MYTLNKDKVYAAMDQMGINEGIIDELTRRNFFKEVMSADDPDSKDIFKLYGILGISNDEPKGGNRRSTNLITTRVGGRVDKQQSTIVSGTIGNRNMVKINPDRIIKLIETKGWGIGEFAEYAGLTSYTNFTAMLKRGTLKPDTVCLISHVLKVGIKEFCDVRPKGVGSMSDIQPMPAKFKGKNYATTIDTYADKLRIAVKVYGLSIEAFAGDIKIPVGLLKELMMHDGKMPISSAHLCKKATGIDVTRKEVASFAQPLVIEAPPKEEVKEVHPAVVPEPKRDDSTKQHVSFEEYCRAEREKKELETFLENQHKQESLIKTNQLIMEEKRNQAVTKEGYISIEALTQITNMLSTDPQVKDLFVTLSILPDEKRKQIIQAMNTLITAMQ
jgi:hypothetical protein